MGFAYELLIGVAVVFAQVETVNATHRTVDEMVTQSADERVEAALDEEVIATISDDFGPEFGPEDVVVNCLLKVSINSL